MLKLLPDASPTGTKFRFDGFLKRAQDIAGCCHPRRHCLPFCCPADGRDNFMDVRRLSKCLPEVHRGLRKNAILGLLAGPEPPITLTRAKRLNLVSNSWLED